MLGSAQTRQGTALHPPKGPVPLESRLLPRFWQYVQRYRDKTQTLTG